MLVSLFILFKRGLYKMPSKTHVYFKGYGPLKIVNEKTLHGRRFETVEITNEYIICEDMDGEMFCMKRKKK